MKLTETEKFNMIKSLMTKYSFFNPVDCDLAIEFVSDLLELEIEQLKQNEPYAIQSIREITTANYRVRDLLDVIEEMRKKQ